MFNKIKRTKQLKIVLNENKIKAEYIKQINQGFYGYVYLINTTNGKKFIAKVYKKMTAHSQNKNSLKCSGSTLWRMFQRL